MFNYELERGYTMCPRAIDKLSEELCKIYKHLLAKATYKPRGELGTGQVMTTISQLRAHHRSMNFTKWKMESSLRKLEELELITWQRGRQQVPSLITILNYNTLQKPMNYGKGTPTLNQPRTNLEPTLNQPYKPIKDNDLDSDANLKPTLNQPKPNLEPTPIKERKNNVIKHNINTEPILGSLLDDLKDFCKKRTILFPDDKRIFKTHTGDVETINLLLEKYNRSKIKYYWELFFLDPTIEGDIEATVFYKSKPATLPLFAKWIKLAEKDQPRLNVFKKLRSK